MGPGPGSAKSQNMWGPHPRVGSPQVSCERLFFVALSRFVVRVRTLGRASKALCRAPKTAWSRTLGRVARARNVVSNSVATRLCHVVTLFPQTQSRLKYHFTTWEPPPMVKLRRDRKFYIATQDGPTLS